MENHCNNPTQRKNSSTIIAFDQCIEFIEKAGKAYFCPGFKIDVSDHTTLFKLLVYFYKDVKNAQQMDINLNKGILLSGPVGCGKTSLMTIMRLFLSPREQYVVKSTRDINYEFIRDGFPVINKFSKGSFHKVDGETLPKTYCFDDLGVESNIKYYGNETNVMAEILLSRYDMYIQQKMLTHITTNLNAAELENLYGNRARSRLREMMNVIAFDKKSKDKRQ